MFSNNWQKINTKTQQPENGILITSYDEHSLVVRDLVSSTQTVINMYSDLPTLFKYRCEILAYIENRLRISNDKEKFIDTSAAELIDKICEANRLLA